MDRINPKKNRVFSETLITLLGLNLGYKPCGNAKIFGLLHFLLLLNFEIPHCIIISQTFGDEIMKIFDVKTFKGNLCRLV